MPLLLIMLAIILAVAAFRNTASELFTAVSTDVGAFGKWLLAIFAIGLLGYIPKFQIPARLLLALVLIVAFAANYQAILDNYQSAFSNIPNVKPKDPAARLTGGIPVDINTGTSSTNTSTASKLPIIGQALGLFGG